MFAGMLLGIVLAMWLFPDIPLSRAMHRAFVARPLEFLAGKDRRHLIFGIIALGMLFSFAELILVLGSSDLVMLMAWDVSLYVDAVIATWTVAAVARLKSAWRYVVTALARPLRSIRPRTSRRRAAETRPPANDADEDGPRWSYATAA